MINRFKLFFAASSQLNHDMKALDRAGQPDVLYSYHYYRPKATKLWKYLKENIEIKDNTFIDSGAFSSHTLGVELKIDDYIKDLHSLGAEEYAGLDDIKDPRITLANMSIMESNGLNPWPVFHMGEEIKYLRGYLEKYDKLALGGMVASSNIDGWLQAVWREILTINPDCQVHGFGMTSQKLMEKYPFSQCDSSSWVGVARFAVMPVWSEAKNMIYSEELWKYMRRIGFMMEDEDTGEIRLYTRGDPLGGEVRVTAIAEACKAFRSMSDHIDGIRKKRDYSYLTAQGTLF